MLCSWHLILLCKQEHLAMSPNDSELASHQQIARETRQSCQNVLAPVKMPGRCESRPGSSADCAQWLDWRVAPDIYSHRNEQLFPHQSHQMPACNRIVCSESLTNSARPAPP